MKRTVLLFQPRIRKNDDCPSMPLALLTISSLLVKEGYNIKIYDNMVDKKSYDKILENLDGAICVGFSVWTGYSIKDSLDLCKKIKKINPDVPIVWGGWHPSLLPLETIKHPCVDIIVRGQGEVTFLKLVKSLEKGKPLSNIKGVTYKRNGKIITNGDRERVPLDKLPPVPYHLINVEDYFNQECGNKVISYVSSQGCPYNCYYCADATLYKNRRMELSAERVISDLRRLKKKYSLDGFHFMDTNFFVNKERIKKIFKTFIDEGWNVKWWADVSAKVFRTFDDDLLRIIKDSGCQLLICGAESGSQRILDFINKGVKVDDNLNVARRCNDLGIRVRFPMMFGFPCEQDKDLEGNLNLIKELYKINPNSHIVVYFFMPYPATRLFNLAVDKYGFKPPRDLEGWADFDAVDTINKNINIPWLSNRYKEKVKNFIFYLNFVYNSDLKNKFNNSNFKLFYILLHNISRFRLDHNFFRMPIERKFVNMIKKLTDYK